MTTFSNVTYDELSIGQSDSMTRTVTEDDVKAFAMVTHDYNPAHLDSEYADNSMFKGKIAHGMWAAGLISALLGTKFPGVGTIYINQTLSFRRPVHFGDTLTATLTVKEKNDEKKWVTLDCQVTNQEGKAVVNGEAQVIPPSEKISRDVVKLDAMQLTQQFV
ncbi:MULTISPECIES: MaoC/PaaZ C-terminal domain-containing protein [unclassified Moraxella]|uniref:MaoC/PaaZ C-terminal domain-containing protein n=1 Tax=unclassified Moraxella TaxID=2685852 RepID=UPI003AF7A02D